LGGAPCSTIRPSLRGPTLTRDPTGLPVAAISAPRAHSVRAARETCVRHHSPSASGSLGQVKIRIRLPTTHGHEPDHPARRNGREPAVRAHALGPERRSAIGHHRPVAISR
jgi:hypothetical protein